VIGIASDDAIEVVLPGAVLGKYTYALRVTLQSRGLARAKKALDQNGESVIAAAESAAPPKGPSLDE
jgi:hypothetical protein